MPGQMMGAPPGMNGQAGGGMQQPLPPGSEAPTPADLPTDVDDPNQGLILAAILGGSALIGTMLGCVLFRKKGDGGGDSDSDADSEDDESDDSDDSE